MPHMYGGVPYGVGAPEERTPQAQQIGARVAHIVAPGEETFVRADSRSAARASEPRETLGADVLGRFLCSR